MRTGLAVLSLLALAANRPAAPEPDWSDLCKVLELPDPILSSHINLGIVYDDWGNFYYQDIEQIRATIEELRRSLTGNPGDAEICFRLSQLCSSLRERTQAHKWTLKAVKLYRTRAKATPNDPALLCRHGDVLLWNEDEVEARRIFQRARAIAPTAWEVWAGLAGVKECRIDKALWPREGLGDSSGEDTAQVPDEHGGAPLAFDKI